MHMTNKIAATAAAAAVLLSGAVISASPASAGTGACSLGYACAWMDSNYDGRSVALQYYIADMGVFGLNDQTSSIANNGRTMNVAWYTYSSYQGRSWVQTRGNWYSDLAGTWFQDQMRSAKFI